MKRMERSAFGGGKGEIHRGVFAAKGGGGGVGDRVWEDLPADIGVTRTPYSERHLELRVTGNGVRWNGGRTKGREGEREKV